MAGRGRRERGEHRDADGSQRRRSPLVKADAVRAVLRRRASQRFRYPGRGATQADVGASQGVLPATMRASWTNRETAGCQRQHSVRVTCVQPTRRAREAAKCAAVSSRGCYPAGWYGGDAAARPAEIPKYPRASAGAAEAAGRGRRRGLSIGIFHTARLSATGRDMQAAGHRRRYNRPADGRAICLRISTRLVGHAHRRAGVGLELHEKRSWVCHEGGALHTGLRQRGGLQGGRLGSVGHLGPRAAAQADPARAHDVRLCGGQAVCRLDSPCAWVLRL